MESKQALDGAPTPTSPVLTLRYGGRTGDGRAVGLDRWGGIWVPQKAAAEPRNTGLCDRCNRIGFQFWHEEHTDRTYCGRCVMAE